MTNEHNIWAIGLYACELLNFINVIVQVILIPHPYNVFNCESAKKCEYIGWVF